MKEYTIILLLVLFELRSYHGHSISNIETKSSVDAYEVKEGNSSLTIINPKAEKPTLREIIYYHIIEKAYEEHKVENDDITDQELPDIDITRPITNGHGYQFLGNDDERDDSNTTDKTPDIDERINSDEHTDKDTNDKEPHDGNIARGHLYDVYPDEEIKLVGETNDGDYEYDDEVTTVTMTNTDEYEQTEDSSTTVIQNIETITVQPEVGRRKRNIDYSQMPAAPSLPKFRIDVLPKFIKNLISQQPETHEMLLPAQYIEDEFEEQIDNLEEAINRAEDENIERKGKTYGMSLAENSGEVWSGIDKAHYFYHVGEPEEVAKETRQFEEDKTIYPKIDKRIGNTIEEDKVIDTELEKTKRISEESTTHSFEGYNVDSDWKVIDNTTENTVFKDNVVQQRRGKTYGMSLAGDSGTVWNDLDETHYAYHVGEPETLTSTLTPEEKTPVSKEEIPETTQKPNDYTTTNSLASVEDQHEELDQKEIEGSMKDIESLFEEMLKNITRKPEETTESNKVSEYPNTKITEPTTETSNKSTPKPDRETEGPGSSENKVDETEDDKGLINDRKDKNKNSTMSKDEKSKQHEFVQELIKNKYFWEWVNDSSKAYLEILMKKADALISAEVKKQIDQYFETHKNDKDNCKPEGSNNKNSTVEVKPVETNNVTTPKENTNATINKVNTNNNINIDKNITSITKNPSLNKTEDGNDKTSKKHKDEKTEAKKSESPVRIEAQNIYGNSVGNAKVTNIFIFNVSNTSDLSSVKPLNNGTNGVYVFGVDEQKAPDNNHNTGNTTEKVNTMTEQSTASSTEKTFLTTTEKIVSTSEKATSISTIPETITENTSTTNQVMSTTEKVPTTSTTDKIEVPTENDVTTEQVTSTSEKPNAATIENINNDISTTEKDVPTEIEKVTTPEQISSTEMPNDITTTTIENIDTSTIDKIEVPTENNVTSEQVTSTSEKPNAATIENINNDISTTEKNVPTEIEKVTTPE